MTSPREPDPAAASAELVESLTRLVRAEAKVLSTELMSRVSRRLGAFLFVVAALVLTPATLTVVAFGPFLARQTSWLVTTAAAMPLLALTLFTLVKSVLLVSRGGSPPEEEVREPRRVGSGSGVTLEDNPG